MTVEPVNIDVPLKRDREIAEARRRELLAKLIYASGGVLVFALVGFIIYKGLYP